MPYLGMPGKGILGRGAFYRVTGEAVAGKLRLTGRWLYSSYRPQDVGSEFTFEVEMADSQAKWWYIGADGKRGLMGAGRLLK